MLTAHNDRLTKRLLTLGAACLALSGTGCASSVSGEQSTHFHFLVEPAPDTTFNGWTEITVGGDIHSVSGAELWGVTLNVQSPPEADLSFLSTLTGQAIVGTTATTVVTDTSFPAGQQSATMKVVYLGNLQTLFKDDHTIHINWSGDVNPNFTAWPTGGIWVQGEVVINIE